MSSEKIAKPSDELPLKVPAGPFTALPEDYKALDAHIIHEILCVAGLKKLSQLKDGKDEKEIHWKSIGEKNGIQMDYAWVQGSNNYFFKGFGRIPASLKVVEGAMRDISNMKMPPLIWWRDFCWYAVDQTLPDGTFVTTGKSIITDLCPDKSGMVRGEIRASGYILQPVADKPNECDVTYIVQTDPKGWIPTWVVNIVAKSQAFNPGVIKSLAPKFMEQLKGQASPDDKENKSTKMADDAPPK